MRRSRLYTERFIVITLDRASVFKAIKKFSAQPWSVRVFVVCWNHPTKKWNQAGSLEGEEVATKSNMNEEISHRNPQRESMVTNK